MCAKVMRGRKLLPKELQTEWNRHKRKITSRKRLGIWMDVFLDFLELTKRNETKDKPLVDKDGCFWVFWN